VKFHRKDLYNFHIFSHEEQKFEQAAPVGGLDFTKKEKIQNPKKMFTAWFPLSSPMIPWMYQALFNVSMKKAFLVVDVQSKKSVCMNGWECLE
jgi:hypothetical protein